MIVFETRKFETDKDIDKIEDLLDKHMAEEKIQREQLEEKVNFYEKEFNINPLSWGKRKKK